MIGIYSWILLILLVTTNGSLPAYFKINKKYKDYRPLIDIVGGITASVDIYLSSFQKDFLSQFSSNKTASKDDPTKVEDNIDKDNVMIETKTEEKEKDDVTLKNKAIQNSFIEKDDFIIFTASSPK